MYMLEDYSLALMGHTLLARVRRDHFLNASYGPAQYTGMTAVRIWCGGFNNKTDFFRLEMTFLRFRSNVIHGFYNTRYVLLKIFCL